MRESRMRTGSSVGYYGASAVNVADITVVADAAGGEANATGMRSIGYSFDATTSNEATSRSSRKATRRRPPAWSTRPTTSASRR